MLTEVPKFILLTYLSENIALPHISATLAVVFSVDISGVKTSLSALPASVTAVRMKATTVSLFKELVRHTYKYG